MKKVKKRGVKPGTKRGPYKKLASPHRAKIDQLTNELRKLIQEEIKHLNAILSRIKK